MMHIKSILKFSGLMLLLLLLSSCGDKQEKADEKTLETTGEAKSVEKNEKPSLPMRYQRPAYMVGDEMQVTEEDVEEVILKVGATIRSTIGPQPLWDIVKRLAAMKGMNVSWESDVDQNVLVDVDINSNDDFYKSIDNLLRQVDYYHEMQDNTIVVKYKETRQYHIGMPFTKQLFETGTGGNLIGGNRDIKKDSLEGTIRLDSKGNEYDLWENIEENLKAILNVWETEAVTVTSEKDEEETNEKTSDDADETETSTKEEVTVAQSTRRISGNTNIYTIDKPIGLITVTAPRPILDKLDNYFDTLKSHLYKQISIEAKIVEVVLKEDSRIGIDWNKVLSNFNVSGMVEFGSQALGGQVWPYIFSEDQGKDTRKSDGAYTKRTYDPTRFVSKVKMNNRSFDLFLNALENEGQTKILSNPKISVLNGQPALITVGRNVTYIEDVEAKINSETGIITLSVDTDRILSGIGLALTATVIDTDEVIMNLVPVTSELLEPIEYIDIGNLGGTVGLPVVNIREMSTMVRVKNGEMLVVGGLISDNNDEEGEFIPLLGDIPLIKYLFGYEKKKHTKRELIILLKPVIM